MLLCALLATFACLSWAGGPSHLAKINVGAVVDSVGQAGSSVKFSLSSNVLSYVLDSGASLYRPLSCILLWVVASYCCGFFIIQAHTC